MRYGDIAAELNKLAHQLTELADKLNRIEDATPTVSIPNKACQINKLALTTAEAAELLSISKVTMYRMTSRDDFPCIRAGKR